MSSGLREVMVIPAGGGKSTLCQDPYYLDVDALYSLEETNETYDRINGELERRAAQKPSVDPEVIKEHRQRLAEYEGPAQCLLVHSLELAQRGGLKVTGALVPTTKLHETGIEDRNESGRWFARETRNNVIIQCKKYGRSPTYYDTWDSLGRIIDQCRQASEQYHTSRSASRSPGSTGSSTSSSQGKESQDEEYLVSVLSLAIGCDLGQEL